MLCTRMAYATLRLTKTKTSVLRVQDTSDTVVSTSYTTGPVDGTTTVMGEHTWHQQASTKWRSTEEQSES